MYSRSFCYFSDYNLTAVCCAIQVSFDWTVFQKWRRQMTAAIAPHCDFNLPQFWLLSLISCVQYSADAIVCQFGGVCFILHAWDVEESSSVVQFVVYCMHLVTCGQDYHNGDDTAFTADVCRPTFHAVDGCVAERLPCLHFAPVFFCGTSTRSLWRNVGTLLKRRVLSAVPLHIRTPDAYVDACCFPIPTLLRTFCLYVWLWLIVKVFMWWWVWWTSFRCH